MACTVTLAGIAQDCRPNLSGIKRIAVANYVEGGFKKAGDDQTVTIETSLTGWVELVSARQVGALTKTLTRNEQTGVLYYTNELVAQFNHMDGDNGDAVDKLGQGRLVVIAEDMNGTCWALGVDDYVYVSATTGQTGAAMDDGNFWSVTFTEYSQHAAYNVAAFPEIGA